MAGTRTSLTGLGVLVTRPEEQARGLCAALAVRGARPLRYPLLAIRAQQDDTLFAALAQRLDEFDLVFFVSPNAVMHGLAGIRAQRDWPADLPVATVGPGSVAALREHGFSEVIAPEQGFNSEAVLALPAFQPHAMAGKRVLIMRGDGGRPLLADTLRARGAEVEFLCCYHRYCPQASFAPVQEWLDDNSLHVLTVSSTEALQNLIHLAGPDGLARIAGLPLLASHPRIAGVARSAGFRQVIETATGDDGVLQALESQQFVSLG